MRKTIITTLIGILFFVGSCEEKKQVIDEDVIEVIVDDETEVVLPSEMYYVIDACVSTSPSFTTSIKPEDINQLYILPGSENIFYIYNGVVVTDKSNLNGSIQIVSGKFNCPE